MEKATFSGRLFVSFIATLACTAHPLLAQPIPYGTSRIVLNPVAGNVMTMSLNDAGQIAATVINPTVYGSTSVRIDPDGRVVAAGPIGCEAYAMLPDGRVLSDGTLPNGRLLMAVGDETGYSVLSYPDGVSTSAYIAASAGDIHGSVVGCVDGQVVEWAGPDLRPTILGRVGDVFTGALGISRSGQYIVGQAGIYGGDPTTTGFTQPYIYSNGTFTPIDVPGFSCSVAVSVNDAGVVVGYALDTPHNIRRGFIWRDGVLTWLNPLDQNVYSDPRSINDNGLIVGTAGIQAMLWDLDGHAYQLSDLAGIDTSRTGFIEADSINDSNQIIIEGASLDYPRRLRPLPPNPPPRPHPPRHPPNSHSLPPPPTAVSCRP